MQQLTIRDDRSDLMDRHNQHLIALADWDPLEKRRLGCRFIGGDSRVDMIALLSHDFRVFDPFVCAIQRLP
jgi:hypothetical protein